MRVILPTDIEFQVPMEPQYAALVRKSIKSLAEEEGYAESDCMDIEIAIGEAVTNAICYGRPPEGEGRVRVQCRVTPYNLIIEIEDESRAKCLPLPKALPDADNEHGRGWILIQKLMDRVSVRCTDTGMLVRMVKQRQTASASLRQNRHLPTVA